ncbi:reticulocyte-binding protein 2 a [Apiospora marii]|uniref:reticulocyte-binding protein 2 a n=1 Tax=Apiospora marii TaxID=335849 RepID=UPI00312D166B
MVSSRKRTRRDAEPEADSPAPAAPPANSDQSQETSLLHRIRNMWQFANLFQWIYLFGKVVKIDDSIDIDVLETECLKSHSTVLVDIGLCLLKFVSSHRGLTPDLFDEYTRRQYVSKDPDHNPFGTEEQPNKFHDFDVLTKLRVLHKLTQWVMLHPERIREKMDEQRVSDQTEWRIEPYGWDSDDRTYFLLDDDRLYRMTDAPPPDSNSTWKPKRNTKKAKAAASRAAKRRRVSRSAAADPEEDEAPGSEAEEPAEPEDDGLGGAKWECIAVSLPDVQAFLATMRKTRDENEKVLRDRIEEGLVPILEKHEESRKRKALAREKELLNMEKLAHAKRSSRIANKAEQQKHDQQIREEEERHRREALAAKKEEQKRAKIEKERDSRLVSREKRLKEREARRIQHEEELAQLSEDSRNLNSGTGRLSERRLQAEIDRNKQALKELDDEEEWTFDCVCGMYGQVDDGTHSIACENCNVWQHSKCAGVSQKEADRADFHFICGACKNKGANAKQTVIKLKVKNQDDESSSPASIKQAEGAQQQPPSKSPHGGLVVEIPNKGLTKPDLSPPSGSGSQIPPLNGTQLQQGLKQQTKAVPSIPVKHASQAPAILPPSPYTLGEGLNPFSSPHPQLSPPQQSPNKSRAYSTISKGNLPPKGLFHVSSPKTNGAAPVSSSMPPHADVSVPSVAARSDSPLKQPLEAAANSLPALSPPSVSFSSGQTTSSIPAGLSTPQLKPTHPSSSPRVSTPTLPPSQNGLSPQKKRSPPPQSANSSNGIHSTPAPAIYPPATSLSPSPKQQINTPPVKSSEPVRPVSPSGSTRGL